MGEVSDVARVVLSRHSDLLMWVSRGRNFREKLELHDEPEVYILSLFIIIFFLKKIYLHFCFSFCVFIPLKIALY